MSSIICEIGLFISLAVGTIFSTHGSIKLFLTEFKSSAVKIPEIVPIVITPSWSINDNIFNNNIYFYFRFLIKLNLIVLINFNHNGIGY